MKYIKKTSSPPLFFALLAGALLFGLVSPSALAVGTASGTTINNMAKLSYSVGAVAQNEICSSPTGNSTGNGGTTGTTCSSGTNGAANTSFVVDNKVNLTVSLPVNLTTVPGTTKQALAYTVTNLGNTTQRYALTANAGAATIVTMSSVAIYLDVNASGTWDVGDTLYGDASTFGDVAAGGTLKVLIVADTPLAAVNGQTALFDLQAQTVGAAVTGSLLPTTATAGANTAGVDVVFADAQGTIDAVTPDGKHSASATYTIGSAILSVAKSVAVLCDPFNGGGGALVPKNIPGAVVQYAITITNTGASAATLATVTDNLPATLAWDPKLINGVGAGGATCTSAGGVQQSAATGFNAIRGVGATTYVAPGPGNATQATTAGATAGAGPGNAITIDFATLAGTSYGAVNASLAAGSYITVYFNAIVQ